MNKTLLNRLSRLEQAMVSTPTEVRTLGLLLPKPLDSDNWESLTAACRRRDEEGRKDHANIFDEALAETGIQLDWQIWTSHGWKPCDSTGKMLNAS